MHKRLWKLPYLIAIALLFYLGVAEAKEVDWGALNPALKDATFVADRGECESCHEDYVKAFDKTNIARSFRFNPPKQGNVCEVCHGPSSKHLKEAEQLQKTPGGIATIVSYTPKSPLTPQQRSKACLQCHEGTRRMEGGLRMEWHSGLHNASDVTCNSCHYVMERRSDKSLFIYEDAKTACYKCHPDRKSHNLKASHMPIKEGKIDCNNCHNPHSSSPKMLKASSTNEMCYSCHAEKRGPFLWEHAVVRENCVNCHDPHGSNNPGLLNAKGPFLCTRCHQYGGHVNLPRYNRSSQPYGQGCINCHTRIHGSNHPSGAKLTR